ncbi:alanine racemase [Phytomonospora endophytica]|uniref:D-serine deaminase-like pyridoxal phosphate-dependent protein n=1 Tax=Phytomonospora endophytica TaxID=714109 RepID=A0A841FEF9_9ACTN|nr:alanine racemase [Phytomonospora endophytica]MBB6034224.1 D-serine deaminase-like pyridoxal phosphate-dependent protein [Phytomonospora endophytica]GIG66617.1 alanine racemase [Phytomonospora endophytica]
MREQARLDGRALDAARGERLDWRFKALPPSAHGSTLDEWLATGPRLSDLGTPLMTLDADALAHNISAMADWCASAGVAHAPHGKTTMAPALWKRQFDAGAVAISLATVPQLRVARAFGVSSVLLANELSDPAALDWLAGWAAEGAEIRCLVDSVAGVSLMDDALRDSAGPLDVCVELGAPGARAGARGLDAAREVAEAVQRSSRLRLAGVSGWDGGVAHDATPGDLAKVDALLAELRSLHESLKYETDVPVVTAGGSAYFDQVAENLADLDDARVVVRAGSYITHDDGTYVELSPGLRGRSGPVPRPALRAFGRVISRPETDLAILDIGRRDVPFDAGLPVPLDLPGASIVQLNDQHAFLTGEIDGVAVGDKVRLGISHPCTAFDKWNLIPVCDAEGTVVDAIRTYF